MTCPTSTRSRRWSRSPTAPTWTCATDTWPTTSPRWPRRRPTSSGSRSSGVRGRAGGIGDSTHPFTIQSVVKPFLFALVCEALGHREVRERLGVNATGLPFDSVMAVEIAADGLTNPLVNSGAIAATSLAPGETAEQKWEFLRRGALSLRRSRPRGRRGGARLRAGDERSQRGDGAADGRARPALLRPGRGHRRLHAAVLPEGHGRRPGDDGGDARGRRGQPGDPATRGQPGHLSPHVGRDAHGRSLRALGRLALRDRAAGQERGERRDRHGRTRQGRAGHLLATAGRGREQRARTAGHQAALGGTRARPPGLAAVRGAGGPAGP